MGVFEVEDSESDVVFTRLALDLAVQGLQPDLSLPRLSGLLFRQIVAVWRDFICVGKLLMSSFERTRSALAKTAWYVVIPLLGENVECLIGTLHAFFMQAHLAVLDGIYKVSMSTKFHKKRTDFDPVMILFRFFLAG